ncbi:hypothetical protein HanRHA438_Chr06g0250841 [Helianthus annuus]|nr:hypothetical protein HanRHA438_Chr06g0250841 [Helianthus annuus]
MLPTKQNQQITYKNKVKKKNLSTKKKKKKKELEEHRSANLKPRIIGNLLLTYLFHMTLWKVENPLSISWNIH